MKHHRQKMADDVGVDDEADDGARRVVVLFKATGDAPILRRNRVRVRADAAFEDVVARLSRLVRVERAFAYLGAAFTPRHDATIGDLCDGYGERNASGGKLVVFYSTTPAWG
tara:strand:- start:1721 stop:2056 length:336 start_codon:yes stop_codon:yes gene_type:complete